MIHTTTATAEDLPTVMNILDGALLAVGVETVRARIDAEEVLVATDSDRILGVLVLDGTHISAIAVRPNRRGQGIGSALVETAGSRGELTAGFRPGVRRFYESLGFVIDREGERWCGRRPET